MNETKETPSAMNKPPVFLQLHSSRVNPSAFEGSSPMFKAEKKLAEEYTDLGEMCDGMLYFDKANPAVVAALRERLERDFEVTVEETLPEPEANYRRLDEPVPPLPRWNAETGRYEHG